MQITGVQEEFVHCVLKQVLFNDLRQLSDRIKELLYAIVGCEKNGSAKSL
jgi:hypothetical protein